MKPQSRGRLIHCAPELILELLEERIVLDATVDQQPQDHPDNAGSAPVNTPGGDVAAAAGAPQQGGNAALPPQADGASNAPAQVFQQQLNVVLVSNAIDQIKAISDSTTDGSKVVVYDGAKQDFNSVVGELQALVESTGQKIGHLAILSHGDPGVLKIADHSIFSSFTVENNPAPWQTLGALLGENARIDLYGCDIGKGPDGVALVNSIAAATGSVVWASNDTTGSAPGADWHLEVKSGASVLGSLLDTEALSHYSFVLDNSGMTNAGFETNSTTGWTTTNTFAVVNASTGGTHGGYNAGASPFSAVSTYMLRLDSNDTTTGDLNTYATISQTFQYQYPDQIVFAYNFVTQDGYQSPTQDYSLYDQFGYSVTINGNQVEYYMIHSGDVRPPTPPALQLGVLRSTGWITESVDLTAYGVQIGDTVNLTVWAGNTNDNQYDSWAFVDLRQPPVVSGAIPNQTLFEDAAPVNITLSTYFTDRETPAANLVYTVIGNTNPSLFDSTNIAGGVLTLDTAPNAFGTATITLRCTDQHGGMVDSSFLVTVVNVYDLPWADPVSVTAPMNGSVTFKVIGHDLDRLAVDATQQQFRIPTGYYPKHGDILPVDALGAATTIQYDAAGKYFYQVFTYTPDADYWGEDSFLFVFETRSGAWNGYNGTARAIGAASETYNTYDLAVVDLNSDGRNDLVEANNGGATNQANYFHLNDLAGFLQNGVSMDQGGSPLDSSRIAVGDLNNDGYPDAVVRNTGTDQDAVYLWNPVLGQFATPTLLPHAGNQSTGAIALADFNADGNLDIIIGHDSTGDIFFGNGNGTFTGPTALPLPTGMNGLTSAVGVGDFNADGYPDIFLGKSNNTAGSNAFWIYYNHGDGTYLAGEARSVGATGVGSATYAAVGDVEGDGDLDIAVARGTVGGAGNQVNYWFRNDGITGGLATFTQANMTGDSRSTQSLRLADIDRDGDLDALLVDYNQTVKYELFTGGAFTGPANISGANANNLGSAAGDIDGDRDIEFIAGVSGSQNRLYDNLGFAVGNTTWRNGGLTAASIHVEPIFNWSFENPTAYAGWTMTETYEITPPWGPPPAYVLPEFGTFGLVHNQPGGVKINFLDSIHDYYPRDNNDQQQFSINLIDAIPGFLGVTVKGSKTEHTAVVLSGGLRDATLTLTQPVNLPRDQYLKGLTLEWDLSYWNNNPAKASTEKFSDTQLVEVYLYDWSTGSSTPVWRTTNADSPVVGTMKHYSVKLGTSDPLVQKLATAGGQLGVKFRVCGMDWYLDAAIDDFKLVPIRYGWPLGNPPPEALGMSAPADTGSGKMALASEPVFAPVFTPLLDGSSLASLNSDSALSVPKSPVAGSGLSLLSMLDSEGPGSTSFFSAGDSGTILSGASFTGGTAIDVTGGGSYTAAALDGELPGPATSGPDVVASAYDPNATGSDALASASEYTVDPFAMSSPSLQASVPGESGPVQTLADAQDGVRPGGPVKNFDPRATLAFDLSGVTAFDVLDATILAVDEPLPGMETRELLTKMQSGMPVALSLDRIRLTDLVL